MKSSLRSTQTVQFLAHLHRTLKTREGQDVVLLFAGEAMRLVTFIMDFLTSYLRKIRLNKDSRLSKLLPQTSRIQSLSNSTNRAADCSRALMAMLEEWQVMNRLWGVLDMWMAARGLITQLRAKRSAGESIRKIDVFIQASQALCLTSFHVSEALGFLSSKGIAKRSPKTEEKLTFLAIRSWAAFTLIEIGRLSLDWVQTTGDKSGDWKMRWKKDILQNLAWMSVASHWSLRQGFLPEACVSPLSVFATWSLVKDAWAVSA
ncbi:hypothetical protein F53441_12153 [Fusarium austroafricanum]|uniref:Uncharacterized protein n=1 Tax=Fusarium austroafricanum TaxID=2364996 RepID=A0A8H4K1L4_9HYPO|nr:hypothetical protein F53441_12153 [Fusarium austroafricanum]